MTNRVLIAEALEQDSVKLLREIMHERNESGYLTYGSP